MRAVLAGCAVLCAVAVSTGVWLVFPPAGLIAAGLQGYAGLYVAAYLTARLSK